MKNPTAITIRVEAKAEVSRQELLDWIRYRLGAEVQDPVHVSVGNMLRNATIRIERVR